MTYDFHDAFDLLWRNKIDPNQVNIGLAFYARTFSISNPGCISPGYLFDAGGSAEPCTNAIGIISNPEIMDKLVRKSQGELDKTAASKILKFGRKKGTRPLCENTGEATEPHFTNCEWPDDFSLGRTDIVSEGQCRVTFYLGTSVYCGDFGASFYYTDIYDDDEDLPKEWVKNLTSPKLTGLDENKLSSRSLDNITLDVSERLSDLAKRQDLHKITSTMAAVLIL
ncbi:Chitinase [Fusarium sp. LHS14.1]|nr:Chitinase [Fusarium sp. LHS14.1]